MKKLFIFSFLFAICCAAFGCETSNTAELRKFWNDFREASLKGTPIEIEKFYTFPLQVRGPNDDDKPIMVPKTLFLNNYDVIFRKNIIDGEKAELLSGLEKVTAPDVNSQILQAFNDKECLDVPYSARIESYEMEWKKNGGWRISSIYYVDDFYLLSKKFRNLKRKK